MKLDERTAKLICNLEYLIGNECFNPNSYDGWTGEEGCEFRYPVNILVNEGDSDLTKIHGNVANYIADASPEAINTMKYKFGSNHLFIGIGIKKTLDYLESRYGIDFAELETSAEKKESDK